MRGANRFRAFLRQIELSSGVFTADMVGGREIADLISSSPRRGTSPAKTYRAEGDGASSEKLQSSSGHSQVSSFFERSTSAR